MKKKVYIKKKRSDSKVETSALEKKMIYSSLNHTYSTLFLFLNYKYLHLKRKEKNQQSLPKRKKKKNQQDSQGEGAMPGTNESS